MTGRRPETRIGSTTGSPLARTDDATKRYGTFTAVDTVTMQVNAGEIVGLLGSNGAGKTTLIRMLLGLTTVTDGTVAVFDRAPDRTTRQRLGYVPQGLGLWETLTVQENIAFAAAAFGNTPSPDLTPGLQQVRAQPVAAIGLGLQRQLAFTIALAHHPELLVLDEPTSGLDPLSRARLWDTIHDQADQGIGVLVTTHYMQEAQQCDRLILMSHGKAVAAGTEQDIIGDTTASEIDTDHWAAAFEALDTADLPVTLTGTTVRLADTPTATIDEALARAGITATVRQAPATLEEKMTVIERTVTTGD